MDHNLEIKQNLLTFHLLDHCHHQPHNLTSVQVR